MRSEIKFLRRGQEVRLSGVAPMLTLLDYLQLIEHSVRPREGCAGGDCGACTVVLRKRVGDRLRYQAVNACALLAGQADGAEVVTMDDLADGAPLHPAQQLMADQHGSHCDFCTPEFVMTMFARYHADRTPRLDRGTVNDWIAGDQRGGNGYRPIVEAALSSCRSADADRFTAQEDAVMEALRTIEDDDDVFVGSDGGFFAAPASLEGLSAIFAAHPDAVLVGDATGVGSGIARNAPPKNIWLGRVRGMNAIEQASDAVTFGAMVSHEAALPHLTAIDPDLGELMQRFAGDTPPALIATGATLTVQSGAGQRELAVEDFLLAYQQQDRSAGEFVRSVHVPKLQKHERFRCYRIPKRFDQDISAIMGAFKFTVAGLRIEAARIAFGGTTAIPTRAREAEAALAGADLANETSWQPALAALVRDFTPITVQRASDVYRGHVAWAVLRKALIELRQTSTRDTRNVGLPKTAELTALITQWAPT